MTLPEDDMNRSRRVLRSTVRRAVVTTLRAVSAALPENKRGAPNHVDRMLIVQTGYLGDAVLLTPLIGALKGRFPDAALDLVLRGSQAPVFAHDRRVRRIHRFDRAFAELPALTRALRRERYDIAFDVQGELKTALVAALSRAGFTTGFNCDGLGFLLDHELSPPPPDTHAVDRRLYAASGLLGGVDSSRRPKVFLCDEDRTAVARLVPEDPFTVVHPGTSWPSKRYPEASWAEVVRTLSGTGNVVLTGSKSEASLVEEIAKQAGVEVRDLSGRTGVPGLGAVLERAEVVVSPDTAAAHLARAVGTPTVTMFGPTDPRVYGPPEGGRDQVLSAYDDCVCQGERVCRRASNGSACMMRIPPQGVAAAAEASG